jgi:hypothetical protein
MKMSWKNTIRKNEVSPSARKAFSLLEESLAYMRETYHETKDKRFLELSEDIGALYDSAFPEMGDLYDFRKSSCTQKAGCSCSECVGKALSSKQKKIAGMAEPKDKIDGADFAALREEKANKAKCPHCDGNAPRSECICGGKHDH